jgi:predicted Zn-dependent peptidase
MTRDDLVAYQQAWLRPDKASIYVVSDRTLAEVVPILEKRLGDWRSAAVQAGAKKFVAVPATVSPQIVLIDRPGAAQSVILGAAPTGLKGSDDIISHSLANNVLGGDFVSRLNMDLRERRHWSYGVRSYFDRNMMAMPFMIYAPVQADRTGPALAEIRSEISDFVADRPITMEEFERTIEGAVRGFAGGYETQQQVLTALLTLDKFGRPDDYYQTLSARYKSLTLEQLNGAARSAIRPDHFLWVIVGDAAKVRPQLEGIGLPIRSERDLR